MIGKFIVGKSFSGLIRYLLNDKIATAGSKRPPMEGRAEVLCYNNIYGSQKEIIQQFKEVSQLNRRQTRPVLHLSLSFAKSDLVTNDLIFNIADDLANEFDFEDNQYLLVRHSDTEESHAHVHLCVNRINLKGKTNVSESHSYKRMSDFCRKMEEKYGLQKVLAPRRFLPKNQRLIPRKDNRKLQLKELIKAALSKSKSMEDLKHQLAEQDIKLIKGRGLSFVDQKSMRVKGSELGYSLTKIEKELLANQHPERAKPVIHDMKQRIRRISM